MRRLAIALIATSCATALIACAAPQPPETAPTSVTQPPALADDGYAQIVLTESFGAGPAATRAYLDTDSKLLFAMPNTDKIARPVDFVLVKGDIWPSPGAERILEFSDGHFAFERVTEFSPERFAYQVWGFTSATAKNVDHIYGVQTLTPNAAGGSDFKWTYKLMPNASWKRPLVQRFADGDVTELLQTATTRVADQARTDGL